MLPVATPSLAALWRRTKTIPIVFTSVTYPLGQGFVESLSHPGGALTGFTDFDPPMAGKWLGMLIQIVPQVGHAALLYNPATAPFASAMTRAVDADAPALGVRVRTTPVRDESESETVVANLAHEPGAGSWCCRTALPLCTPTPSSASPRSIAFPPSIGRAALSRPAG